MAVPVIEIADTPADVATVFRDRRRFQPRMVAAHEGGGPGGTATAG